FYECRHLPEGDGKHGSQRVRDAIRCKVCGHQVDIELFGLASDACDPRFLDLPIAVVEVGALAVHTLYEMSPVVEDERRDAMQRQALVGGDGSADDGLPVGTVLAQPRG